MALAKTTKERAVNILLESIGQAAVSWGATPEVGPSASPNLDETAAINVIDEMTRALQIKKDWHWNYRESRTFTADGVTGKVALPANTARVDYVQDEKDVASEQAEDTVRIIERDGFLFDLKNETNVFAVNSTHKVRITYWIDLKDLPESVRYFIIMTARVEFLLRRKGTPEAIALARDAALRAEMVMERDQNLRARRNLREHYCVSRVLARRTPLLGQI